MDKNKLTYDELLKKYNDLKTEESNSIMIQHELAKAKSDLDDELSKFRLMQLYGQAVIDVKNVDVFAKITLDYFIKMYEQARGGFFIYDKEQHTLIPISNFGVFEELEDFEKTNLKVRNLPMECLQLQEHASDFKCLIKLGFNDAYVNTFTNENDEIRGLIVIGHSDKESQYYPAIDKNNIPSFSIMTQSVGLFFKNLNYQEKLETEISEREKMQQALIKSEEALRVMNQDLEHRIQDRTKELKASNLKLKDQASELIQINEDLRRFTSIVSHDLKTPLRSMGSFSGLLKKKIEFKLTEAEIKYLDIIEHGAISMYELIEDLLLYTKVNYENLVYGKAEVRSLVEELLILFQAEIMDKDAVIKNNIEECVLNCDRTKLKQVFSNLIQNAIKFSAVNDQSPIIELTSDYTETHYKFGISDNGIGINPNFKHKVFSEFERLNGNRFQGTGMGLSICHRIVQKHNGDIWFEDNDVGTTFYFTIAREKEPKEKQLQSSQHSY